MSSRTTTQSITNIGSIPITGGTDNPPPAPTRPTTLSASEKEWELEEQLEHNRERLQKLKEKRKAEEAAKKKAEEEAARRVQKRKKAREEAPIYSRYKAAARAVQVRRLEEEAAEKRRRVAVAAAARGRQGPAPSEATTSQQRMEVEIPRLIKKGTGKQGAEARDPDDGDNGSDGGDDEDDEDEKAPCERCRIKKIPCLQQEGKRTTVICKSCHDSKVRCSFSNQRVASKQREGGSGERLAVMESQLAQGLADVRSLR
ncbi:hypothetical protein F5876DRAFT_82657 [Lentinula aff. lateritia]|uniref:Uncharacterized protein n=1 Tax=Lentinula aff. lateritia TaxID=2804960 RepID=A0ACC1TJE8_9AGAR|nr:hypothetical protein F5876DRAFT_82657 [Lentinula aff. lateritia]